MRTKFNLIILIIFLLPFTVRAQDDCTFDFSAVIPALQSATTLEQVAQARAAIQLQEAQCRDHTPADRGGVRTNPVAFGMAGHIIGRKYDGTIQLTDYFDDAEIGVFAKSGQNEEAPSGKHYVMIDFILTCDRDPADSCQYSRIDLSLVGDKGVSYPYDSAPHLRGFTTEQEVFGGGQADLSVAFLVDDGDDNFVLFTEYGDPRTFFATE